MSPFLDYLRNDLVARDINVDLQMKIYPSYESAIDALSAGQIDFARFGPVSYVLAKKKNPQLQLLVMESNGGSKRINGVISVPENSSIKSLEDLRGKVVAFGARRSTTGRYLSQAALVKAGILVNDLGGHNYLGRHDKVAFAVASGQYQAGATNENTFNKYASSKGLRKIAEFPCVTKPWIARQGLSTELFEALRESLFDLKDKSVLKTIKRDGFLPADDSDYDLIREGMQLARKFDENDLSFAVYASHQPSEVYASVKPLLDAVEHELFNQGVHVRIGIKVFPTYEDAIYSVSHAKVDLARLGAASYVHAKERYPGLKLLARESYIRENTGLFVVPAESKITSLQDLKGKRIAFADEYSTEGRYLAQAQLVEEGIVSGDLVEMNYLGRHDRVAYSVARQNYDAGVLCSPVMDKLMDHEKLRVIKRFKAYGKAWVVRGGLDPFLEQQLTAAMLKIKDRQVFEPLGLKTLVESRDSYFDPVREGIKKAEAFGSN
ncbi:hypothetical protein BOW51_08395 [Solemya velesiana gill symbiont]|uniref:Solute-binding protein family 3/N-terminal domain-containing protein n=2 Tax=Solemya velesiana gill symbiont TaxID=1918948 RepID=A0A1T2KTV3_9GAMM|nr:hypothetical protein BOW51_08395 [Solemya velesiana gill symbiont]